MSDKKKKDTAELWGYEKEIDQWKKDLELARQQVFSQILKMIKYFELSNIVY